MERWKVTIALFGALLIAGCQTSAAPVTLKGECNVFSDPKFPVRGERQKDQRWISKTQETGIKVCDWPRPQPD